MCRFRFALIALFLAVCPHLLRAQVWSLDPAVAPVFTNDVSRLETVSYVPTAAGQFLVYGEFTHVNGALAPGLARLGVDGKFDATFAPDLAADERVSDLAALPDGRAMAVIGTSRVYAVPAVAPNPKDDPAFAPAVAVAVADVVAGETTNVAVAGSSSRLVRLRADGKKDTTFAPLTADGNVQLTAAPDGRVLVWGNFRDFGGASRNSLARLKADGTLDASFAPALATSATATVNVAAVAPAADGSLVVSAIVYDGRSPAAFIFRRLRTDGSTDPGFAPTNLNTTFSLLAVQPDGSVLAGNTYARVGLTITAGAAAPAGAVTVPDIPTPSGAFSGFGRFTPTGAVDRTYSLQIPGLKTISRLIPLSAGRVAVEATVGSANAYAGAPAVFTVGANGNVVTDWRKVPGAGEGQRLLAALSNGRLLVAQGTLVVAFSYYPVPFDPTAPAASAIMPVFLGPTLVDATLALSPPDASVAPTTPLATLAATISERYPGNVSRLETDAVGRVIVAGGFTHVDGQSRPGLARFLGSGALDGGFVPVAGELLLVPPDGRLIVRRTTIGPADSTDGFHRYVTQVVRLQDNGQLDAGFTFPSGIDAAKTNWLLGAPDGRLLVSAFDPDDTKEENLRLIWLGADGRRSTTLPAVFSGFTRSYIGVLDAATGSTVASAVASAVLSIGTGRLNVIDSAQILANGRLLVAGDFSRVSGATRPGLVRLNADGTLDTTYVPDTSGLHYRSGAVPLRDGRALVFGSSLGTGRWQPGVIRLRAEGTPDPTFQPPADTIGGGVRVLTDGTYFYNGRRFATDGWPDLNFAPQPDYGSGRGYIYSTLAAADGRLWIGGGFDRVLGSSRAGLARLSPTEIVGITASPTDQRVVAGRDAFFQVAIGTTQPATFQWTRDGNPVPGATTANLRLTAVQTADAGSYRAIVTIGGRTFTSAAAKLTVLANTSRLINFSARSVVGPNLPPQIAGVISAGAPPRTVLLRAVGRGLSGMIGSETLPTPVLTLYNRGTVMGQDRGGATATAVSALATSVGAFPLRFSSATPPGSTLGSALTPTLGEGAFTAATSSGDSGAGVSLFEFYDTGRESDPPLVRNLSVLGGTAPGDSVLTAGFVISGNGPLRLLVRGVGPGLTPFGVSGTINDPKIEVYAGSADGAVLASNAGWNGDSDLADAARQAGAFAFGSRDAGVLLTLEPGAYTAQLSSVAGGAGSGMVEVYVVGN